MYMGDQGENIFIQGHLNTGVIYICAFIEIIWKTESEHGGGQPVITRGN